jgi:uncharacterized YigZ family protein
MNNYTTVLNEGLSEYEDRKSVFYGFAMPVSTEEEALSYIAKIKKRFPDATHHVYAYVLRENSICRFTDDREPQGTAGMPVLDAIRKNGCTDAVIVVVRYFGGVLLGTGGLVHAYSSAANSALKNGRIITYLPYSFFEITVSYADYQKILLPLSEIDFRIDDTDFTDFVKIHGNIISVKKDELLKKITEVTSARAEICFKEEKMSY